MFFFFFNFNTNSNWVYLVWCVLTILRSPCWLSIIQAFLLILTKVLFYNHLAIWPGREASGRGSGCWHHWGPAEQFPVSMQLGNFPAEWRSSWNATSWGQLFSPCRPCLCSCSLKPALRKVQNERSPTDHQAKAKLSCRMLCNENMGTFLFLYNKNLYVQ